MKNFHGQWDMDEVQEIILVTKLELKNIILTIYEKNN